MKKTTITSFLLWTLALNLKSQSVPLEVVVGNRNAFYQHSVGKNFAGNQQFGWLNIASVLVHYDKKSDPENALSDEIMNQTYFVYRPTKGIALLGGGFYTDVTKFRVSAAIQLSLRRKALMMMLAPRIDVVKNGAYELFGFIEYNPKMGNEGWTGYSRFQFMTNHGKEGHNRSYQQFRLGTGYKANQFGLAVTLDQYGPHPSSLVNTGLFIRHVF
ncbi:MAG: hypothetical protein IT270_13100 [Saprospiraceae bacterium]|nr:hypothetical protein [Saprospiraceae bacterium]